MTFLEAMSDYIDISDSFDSANMKVSAYVESTMNELSLNNKKAELKVMQESGNDDDLFALYEQAEEGAIVKLKKAIVAIIEAFKQFISNLKDKVVRIVVSKTTKETLNKVEKKVKLNPFIAKKKVQVIDKKKPLKVINSYKSDCDKAIAKIKGGVFKQSDIEGILSKRDKFDEDYKKSVAGTAALTTVAVGVLIKEINKELSELPQAITKVSNETSQAVENLVKSIDDPETATSIRGAYSAAANFRTKLGKYESNELVDSIMNHISVLKKEVAKIKGDTEADVIKESAEDINDDVDSFLENGYDSDALLAELEDLF